MRKIFDQEYELRMVFYLRQDDIKKGAINIAANIILNETIWRGSSPSITSSLKNRNEPPQNSETNSNVKKSFVFIIKKGPFNKRGLSISKAYVGSRSYLVSAVTS